MAQLEPILVRADKAAKMLDMTIGDFLDLVEAGSLPKAGMFDRWVVADLKRIASGELAFEDEGLDL